MPRYFFTLHDGDCFPDGEGQELEDVDAARRTAVEAAREMIAEEVRRGRLALGDTIAIHDENGKLVATVGFSDAVAVEAPRG